jgi:hypothetical protein
MPNHRRRLLARRLTRGLGSPLLLAGLLVGLAQVGLVPAAAIPGIAGAMTSCQNWTGLAPVNPGTEGNELHSVAVLSGCNVWAVGEIIGPGPDQALIEHWNGSSWTVMPIAQPTDEGFDLSAVQALSPTDIWAVGHLSGTSTQTLVLHWDGKSWTQSPSRSPEPLSLFTGVRAISANDVWAVGTVAADGEPDHTLIEHWDGTAWTVAKFSPPGDLLAAGASSAGDGWAVGQVFTGRRDESLVLHWNGHRWSRVSSPSPGDTGTTLNSVVAVSASDAWAVGSASGGGGAQTLVLHWNGRTWARVKSPNPGGATGGAAGDDGLSGVVAISAGNVVAVGTSFSAHKTVVLQWNGKSWAQIPSPRRGLATELDGVAASSAGNVWAVGAFTTGGPHQAFAMHFAATTGASGAAGCRAVTVDQPPNPGTSEDELFGVAVLSPCKAWAVGDARSGQVQQALVEHWNGSAWTVASTPSPGSGDSELFSVSSVSRSDAWAAGLSGVRPLIEHWNGKTWSLVPSQDFGRRGAQLKSVSAVSARDAWAVGSVGSKSNDGTERTLIEHWTGSSWKVVPSPDPGHDDVLTAVSASPGGNVWAVGWFSITNSQDQPLILRWNGRRWARVASPVGVGNVLSAVTAVSSADAWAAGFGLNKAGVDTALILHWNGRAWARAASPAPGFGSVVSGLAAASAGSVWATGGFVAGGRSRTLILHWNGTRWAQVTSPDLAESELFGVAASTGGVAALTGGATVSNVWAVGDFDATPVVPHILAVHCC